MATGSGTGTPAVSPAVTGNYIVGTDIDNWPGGTSSATKKEIVDRAEQLIESITQDYFYPKIFAIYLDGNGKDKLFLGLTPHILISIAQLFLSDLVMVTGSTTLTSKTGGFTAAMEGERIYISGGVNFIVGWYTIAGYTNTNTVTLNKTAVTTEEDGKAGISVMGGVVEIKISGIRLTPAWWTFDIDSIYLDPEAVTGGVEDLPELLLRMGYQTKLFPKGMGNVKVTGIYGWASCPVAIKGAVIILCRYENDGTLYTKYDDLVSDKLGDASYGRGQKKFLTGVQEADRLIRNYIRNKPMLGAV